MPGRMCTRVPRSYTFTLTNADGTTTKVPARYTYVYQKDAATGDWKIKVGPCLTRGLLH